MSDELKIGWGFRDVSTTEPTCIHGQFYIRISEGILDPITVTALAMESNGEQAVMISCDATSLRQDVIRLVRQNIRELAPEVNAEKVILNATHTHCTGDVNASGMCIAGKDFPVSPEVVFQEPGIYQQFFARKCAEAVADAWNNRSDGMLAWGYGFAATGYSRKTWFFDDLSKRPSNNPNEHAGMSINGHAAMYGNTQDDQFSHYEAGTDHYVNMLFTFSPRHQLTGAIINLSCPSQCSENISMLTADFWHDVRLMLKQKYGAINILPQCAPAGDLSPHPMHYKKAAERRDKLKYACPQTYREQWNRKEIARQICNAFDDTLPWAKNDIRKNVSIRNSVEKIQLERRLPTQKEINDETQLQKALQKQPFATQGTPLERFKYDSTLAARRNRSATFLKRAQMAQDGIPYIMDLHVIAIDDIAFVSSPFELYTDFMHRIQGRSPFTQTFNIQLADNEHEPASGYLATERGVQGGGYSSSRYCNIVSPKGGQQLVEATIRRLNAIL